MKMLITLVIFLMSSMAFALPKCPESCDTTCSEQVCQKGQYLHKGTNPIYCNGKQCVSSYCDCLACPDPKNPNNPMCQ